MSISLILIIILVIFLLGGFSGRFGGYGYGYGHGGVGLIGIVIICPRRLASHGASLRSGGRSLSMKCRKQNLTAILHHQSRRTHERSANLYVEPDFLVTESRPSPSYRGAQRRAERIRAADLQRYRLCCFGY